MKFGKHHIALFYRDSCPVVPFNPLILITSCGKLGKIRPAHGDHGDIDFPCYSWNSFGIYWENDFDVWRNFLSPEKALRAMRRHELVMNLPKAELIGFI